MFTLLRLPINTLSPRGPQWEPSKVLFNRNLLVVGQFLSILLEIWSRVEVRLPIWVLVSLVGLDLRAPLVRSLRFDVEEPVNSEPLGFDDRSVVGVLVLDPFLVDDLSDRNFLSSASGSLILGVSAGLDRTEQRWDSLTLGSFGAFGCGLSV